MKHLLLLPARSVALLAALVLLLSAPTASAQTALNANGGFEGYDLGTPGNTAEWFFQITDQNDADLEIVDDPTFEGDRALSVAVQGTTGANLQFSNQNISVPGPGTYRYSGRARASEDGARIQVVADHHGGSFSWFGNQTFDIGTEWTEMTFEFEVPAESGGTAVERIRATHILKFAENVGKTIFLDDVRVWRVEDSEAMTIAEARAAGAGETVTVEGTVTRSQGAFTYFQDETGGLTIRQTAGDFFTDVTAGTITTGTQIRVTGTLSEFRQLLQINAADLADYEILGQDNTVSAQTITLQELTDNGEAYEAQLVRVTGLETEATGTFAAGTSYDVTDAAGSGVLRIPSANDTEVVGMEIPEEPFTFTGVVGQFHTTDPAAGYQLLAIEETDIEVAGEPVDDGLVTNGSFENTEPGVITDLTGGLEGWIFEVGSSVATAPEFAIVDDVAQHGDQSLRVTINSVGANAWNIQAVADSIPATPGTTYEYSVWARTESGTGTAAFTVGAYTTFQEYFALRDNVTLTEDWQEFSGEFTLPVNVGSHIRAPIHFSMAANEGQVIYIDNLSISAVEGPPVSNEPGGTPLELALGQNYPNPFHSSTKIEYEVGTSSHVNLSVYNVLGQRVATLVDQMQTAGNHTAQFDADELAAGVYFYRITVGDLTRTRQMLLVK